MNRQHDDELRAGKRFSFGTNWLRFIRDFNEERLMSAEQSLLAALGVDSLEGKRFLDIGSGSGLFSLAARKLGAKVYSFDFDPKSVECTNELRRRFFPDDKDWIVDEGSVLDDRYMATLGTFDVVYSWGVLHHTGDMRRAIANAMSVVASNGRAFIAIYNDQGPISMYWTMVKIAYNRNRLLQQLMIALHFPYLIGLRVVVRLLTGRRPIERGMSLWRDMIDWLGGYPFEVAKPEVIFQYFRDNGFGLEVLRTCGGRMGCNEYVFRRLP